MSRPSLDITKTLYDSDGYRHTLVRATPLQILTLVEGFYWLWDRRTGRCLVEGMASHRLNNTRPPGDDLRSGRDPVAETRAFFVAQKAVRSAAASAGAALAAQGGLPGGRPAVSLLALPAPRAAAAIPTAAAARPTRRDDESAAMQGPSLVTAAVMVGFLALALLLPTRDPALD